METNPSRSLAAKDQGKMRGMQPEGDEREKDTLIADGEGEAGDTGGKRLMSRVALYSTVATSHAQFSQLIKINKIKLFSSLVRLATF